jgi:Pyridoxamine 5'-phosphate oxidase
MQSPQPEAMSRKGKGTVAATDAGNTQPLPWSEASARLGGGGWAWLATVRPDGGPHLVPVLCTWADPVLYLAAKRTTRKSRNLETEERCVLSKDAGDVHLVVEGRARRLQDEADLGRASAAFDRVHGWKTWIVGDELDADFGAPTSGGPPYAVYEVRPTTTFAFPTDGESTTPTRWRF